MAFAPWPGCVKSWATSSRILCLRVLLSKWETENGKESALLRMLQSLNMHKANMVGKGYMCVCARTYLIFTRSIYHVSYMIFYLYSSYYLPMLQAWRLKSWWFPAPKSTLWHHHHSLWAFFALATYSIVSKPVNADLYLKPSNALKTNI